MKILLLESVLEGIMGFFFFAFGMIMIGVVIQVIGYALAKITGRPVEIRQKYQKTGYIVQPDHFDGFGEAVQNTVKDASQKSISFLSEKVHGTYKYLFNKIDVMELENKYPNMNYIEYFNVVQEIENKNINADIIAMYQKYRYFIADVDFNKFFEILSQKIEIKDLADLILILDNLGIENTKPFYSLIMDIEKAYWKNDINSDEKNKLTEYLMKKIFSN